MYSGIFLTILVAGLVLFIDAGASSGGEEQKAGPPDEPFDVERVDVYPLTRLNTRSPRSTLRSLRETVNRAFQFQIKGGARSRKTMELLGLSASCLDLSKVPPTLVEMVGIESVLMLKEILDRIEVPAYEEIPDHDAMESNRWSRWSIPHTEITIARVADGPCQGEYLFTSMTVDRLPVFYNRVRHLSYKPGATDGFYESYIYSPGWMIPHKWVEQAPGWAKAAFLGQAVWQWLGMTISFLSGALVIWLVYRMEYQRPSTKTASAWQARKLLFPVSGMILSMLIGYFADAQINITGTVLTVILIGLKLSFYTFGVITLFVLGNVLVRGFTASSRLKPKNLDANLVTLSLRVGILLFVFALIWVAAGDFGLPVTAIFASAGVVGVAVALAARETLANFFGGVSVLLDRPFRTGDYIVLDSGERGEVMEIGLRSTRILTRDEVLICVPNSLITNVKVVNESAPLPHFRVRIKVGVAYGTDIGQVEAVLLDLAKKNDLVAKEPAPRVRFRRFGDSSLDFELLCWAKRPHDKGLLTHTLNGEIYRAFGAAGIIIPFPQRDVHLNAPPATGIS
jgi:MscS family membrane protein